MYTFEMRKRFNNAQFVSDDHKSFNFKEFFRVNENGRFVYEDRVNTFLDNITSPDSSTNYPFSTEQFRNRLRHTLWILPGVKEANALENLMKKHRIFKEEYNIVNVVRNGDDVMATKNDVDRVNEAITDEPGKTKTITLTVRKLTTGVTIKPWTGVIFLSNTNSAMQYLQAAFRAQTPYSSPSFGKKTNCYIFDFAPDRALTVMAESTQLNTGVGKRTSRIQKEKMSNLMNFLPIIGETGQGMKSFKVDTLLAKIKRVYAEKAVRTGFDDDSLYSDELLMMDQMDLKDFNNLKNMVGTTPSEKKPMNIEVNSQGLTDEEYESSVRGEKKNKRERTDEEQDAIDKINKLRKQRKSMISILRSVSIRIPLMIYGMNIDIADDVSIDAFINNVDLQSWKEFMPNGITKNLFRKFSKYYDQDIFIEAGRIIRQKVRALDNLDPLERIEKLVNILGTFRNPDKETVLTPWRVVNMQLGKTIGGFSSYDESYEYTTVNGNSASHWIENRLTDRAFNSQSKILEINAKTGLYPLYAARTIYYQDYQKMINNNAGKFSLADEQLLWQHTIKNNIFMIAKTPMAKTIATRTLAGYKNLSLNVEYIDSIVSGIKEDINLESSRIKRVFKNMKFDVVIGNPPYQESDNDSGKGSARPIYQHFVRLAKELDANLISLITPSVWFTGGKGLDDFRNEMLNDVHLESIYNYETPKDVFPNANLRGGVSYFLINKEYDNSKDGLYVETINNNSVTEKGYRPVRTPNSNIFISSNTSFEILNKLLKNGYVKNQIDSSMFESMVSVRNPFGLPTSFIKDKRFKKNKDTLINPVKVFARGGSYGYCELASVTKHSEWINKVKVLTPFANKRA